MTASPEQYAGIRTAGWYVHTDQGVLLDGPHADEASARVAGNRVAERLRESMRRERTNETDIRIRVEALRVGYGRPSHPHGRFEAT